MKTRNLLIGSIFLVAGLLFYGCLGITEKSSSEPTPVEKAEFESITWIDYKDMGFGVSLKYPSNWEVDTKETGFLTFTPKTASEEPSPYFIKIVKLDNYDNKTLTEYLNLDGDYSMSKIGIDDLVAIKRPEPPESFSHFYYVERSPYIYKFVYMNLGDSIDYMSNQVFYEILNSFRFIPFTAEEEKVSEDAAAESTKPAEETAETAEAVSEPQTEEASAPEETPEETVGAEPAEEPAEETKAEPAGEAGEDMGYFVSGPYKFKALYPASWYYTGNHMGGTDNILHRYGFSMKPDGEVLITLDIVDEAMPSGAVKTGGYEISKTTGGGKVVIYAKLSEQVYKITAPLDMEDMADKMALSILETAE